MATTDPYPNKQTIDDVPPQAMKIIANYLRDRAGAPTARDLMGMIATELGRIDIAAGLAIRTEADRLDALADRKIAEQKDTDGD